MDTRIIYDKKYYKLLAALSSQKMQILLNKYHTKLKKLGVPVKTSGCFFKTAKDYHSWANETLSKGVFYPGLIEDMIINQFFEKPNDDIKLGFWWYIYFGVKKPPIKSTHTKEIAVSHDRSHLKVTFIVYPWTIKKDIIEDAGFWDRVEILQNELKSDKKRQRNTGWRTFERDLRIYELSLSLKRQNKKATPKAILESEEFNELEKTYKIPDSIDTMIPKIIADCKKTFADLKLI